VGEEVETREALALARIGRGGEMVWKEAEGRVFVNLAIDEMLTVEEASYRPPS
jgi:hypothetical protein